VGNSPLAQCGVYYAGAAKALGQDLTIPPLIYVKTIPLVNGATLTEGYIPWFDLITTSGAVNHNAHMTIMRSSAMSVEVVQGTARGSGNWQVGSARPFVSGVGQGSLTPYVSSLGNKFTFNLPNGLTTTISLANSPEDTLSIPGMNIVVSNSIGTIELPLAQYGNDGAGGVWLPHWDGSMESVTLEAIGNDSSHLHPSTWMANVGALPRGRITIGTPGTAGYSDMRIDEGVYGSINDLNFHEVYLLQTFNGSSFTPTKIGYTDLGPTFGDLLPSTIGTDPLTLADAQSIWANFYGNQNFPAKAFRMFGSFYGARSESAFTSYYMHQNSGNGGFAGLIPTLITDNHNWTVYRKAVLDTAYYANNFIFTGDINSGIQLEKPTSQSLTELKLTALSEYANSFGPLATDYVGRVRTNVDGKMDTGLVLFSNYMEKSSEQFALANQYATQQAWNGENTVTGSDGGQWVSIPKLDGSLMWMPVGYLAVTAMESDENGVLVSQTRYIPAADFSSAVKRFSGQGFDNLAYNDMSVGVNTPGGFVSVYIDSGTWEKLSLQKPDLSGSASNSGGSGNGRSADQNALSATAPAQDKILLAQGQGLWNYADNDVLILDPSARFSSTGSARWVDGNLALRNLDFHTNVTQAIGSLFGNSGTTNASFGGGFSGTLSLAKSLATPGISPDALNTYVSHTMGNFGLLSDDQAKTAGIANYRSISSMMALSGQRSNSLYTMGNIVDVQNKMVKVMATIDIVTGVVTAVVTVVTVLGTLGFGTGPGDAATLAAGELAKKSVIELALKPIGSAALKQGITNLTAGELGEFLATEAGKQIAGKILLSTAIRFSISAVTSAGLSEGISLISTGKSLSSANLFRAGAAGIALSGLSMIPVGNNVVAQFLFRPGQLAQDIIATRIATGVAQNLSERAITAGIYAGSTLAWGGLNTLAANAESLAISHEWLSWEQDLSIFGITVGSVGIMHLANSALSLWANKSGVVTNEYLSLTSTSKKIQFVGISALRGGFGMATAWGDVAMALGNAKRGNDSTNSFGSSAADFWSGAWKGGLLGLGAGTTVALFKLLPPAFWNKPLVQGTVKGFSWFFKTGDYANRGWFSPTLAADGKVVLHSVGANLGYNSLRNLAIMVPGGLISYGIDKSQGELDTFGKTVTSFLKGAILAKLLSAALSGYFVNVGKNIAGYGEVNLGSYEKMVMPAGAKLPSEAISISIPGISGMQQFTIDAVEGAMKWPLVSGVMGIATPYIDAGFGTVEHLIDRALGSTEPIFGFNFEDPDTGIVTYSPFRQEDTTSPSGYSPLSSPFSYEFLSQLVAQMAEAPATGIWMGPLIKVMSRTPNVKIIEDMNTLNKIIAAPTRLTNIAFGETNEVVSLVKMAGTVTGIGRTVSAIERAGLYVDLISHKATVNTDNGTPVSFDDAVQQYPGFADKGFLSKGNIGWAVLFLMGSTQYKTRAEYINMFVGRSFDTDEALKILGLKPGVSQAEIKAAYRKLSMRYNADRGYVLHSSEENRAASNVAQVINEAFRALGSKKSISSGATPLLTAGNEVEPAADVHNQPQALTVAPDNERAIENPIFDSITAKSVQSFNPGDRILIKNGEGERFRNQWPVFEEAIVVSETPESYIVRREERERDADGNKVWSAPESWSKSDYTFKLDKRPSIMPPVNFSNDTSVTGFDAGVAGIGLMEAPRVSSALDLPQFGITELRYEGNTIDGFNRGAARPGEIHLAETATPTVRLHEITEAVALEAGYTPDQAHLLSLGAELQVAGLSPEIQAEISAEAFNLSQSLGGGEIGRAAATDFVRNNPLVRDALNSRLGRDWQPLDSEIVPRTDLLGRSLPDLSIEFGFDKGAKKNALEPVNEGLPDPDSTAAIAAGVGSSGLASGRDHIAIPGAKINGNKLEVNGSIVGERDGSGTWRTPEGRFLDFSAISGAEVTTSVDTGDTKSGLEPARLDPRSEAEIIRDLGERIPGLIGTNGELPPTLKNFPALLDVLVRGAEANRRNGAGSHILFEAPTGSGKTGPASAILHRASELKNGGSLLYVAEAGLVGETAGRDGNGTSLARGLGSLKPIQGITPVELASEVGNAVLGKANSLPRDNNILFDEAHQVRHPVQYTDPNLNPENSGDAAIREGVERQDKLLRGINSSDSPIVVPLTADGFVVEGVFRASEKALVEFAQNEGIPLEVLKGDREAFNRLPLEQQKIYAEKIAVFQAAVDGLGNSGRTYVPLYVIGEQPSVRLVDRTSGAADPLVLSNPYERSAGEINAIRNAREAGRTIGDDAHAPAGEASLSIGPNLVNRILKSRGNNIWEGTASGSAELETRKVIESGATILRAGGSEVLSIAPNSENTTFFQGSPAEPLREALAQIKPGEKIAIADVRGDPNDIVPVLSGTKADRIILDADGADKFIPLGEKNLDKGIKREGNLHQVLEKPDGTHKSVNPVVCYMSEVRGTGSDIQSVPDKLIVLVDGKDPFQVIRRFRNLQEDASVEFWVFGQDKTGRATAEDIAVLQDRFDSTGDSLRRLNKTDALSNQIYQVGSEFLMEMMYRFAQDNPELRATLFSAIKDYQQSVFQDVQLSKFFEGGTLSAEAIQQQTANSIRSLKGILSREGSIYKSMPEAGKSFIDSWFLGRIDLVDGVTLGEGVPLSELKPITDVSDPVAMDRQLRENPNSFVPLDRVFDPITLAVTVSRTTSVSKDLTKYTSGASFSPKQAVALSATESGRQTVVESAPRSIEQLRVAYPELGAKLDSSSSLLPSAAIIPGSNRFSNNGAFGIMFNDLFHASPVEVQAINNALSSFNNSLPKTKRVSKLPVGRPVTSGQALDLAIALTNSGVVNISRYDRQGLNVLIALGQALKPFVSAATLAGKALPKVSVIEFTHVQKSNDTSAVINLVLASMASQYPEQVEAVEGLLSELKSAYGKIQQAKNERELKAATKDLDKALPSREDLAKVAASFSATLSPMELVPMLGLATPEQTVRLVAVDKGLQELLPQQQADKVSLSKLLGVADGSSSLVDLVAEYGDGNIVEAAKILRNLRMTSTVYLSAINDQLAKTQDKSEQKALKTAIFKIEEKAEKLSKQGFNPSEGVGLNNLLKIAENLGLDVNKLVIMAVNGRTDEKVQRKVNKTPEVIAEAMKAIAAIADNEVKDQQLQNPAEGAAEGVSKVLPPTPTTTPKHKKSLDKPAQILPELAIASMAIVGIIALPIIYGVGGLIGSAVIVGLGGGLGGWLIKHSLQPSKKTTSDQGSSSTEPQGKSLLQQAPYFRQQLLLLLL
jgi:hypothetical protein